MLNTAPGTVIIGAGHAGFTVATALRDADYEGPITLVNGEDGLPYQRPPLSKAYLLGKVTRERVAFRPAGYYERRGIELVSGRITGIDRSARIVSLGPDEAIDYQHLVLATGARARRLSLPGHELHNIVYLRNIADADTLGPKLRRAQRPVVVGGGFIGLEFAAVAAEIGVPTTVLEAAPRLLPRAVSAGTASFLDAAHRGWGNPVGTSVAVSRFYGDAAGRVKQVELAESGTIPADLVVIGVGATPDTELAESAGLAVDDGILVNSHLRTPDPAVYAIGDCARFVSEDGSTTKRLESVQNATDQARTVARAISGDTGAYLVPPCFWSDQHDIKLQIAGDLTGHDHTVVGGQPEASAFSTYCFRSGDLVAVESINTPSDHVAARKALQRAEFTLDPQLVGPGFTLATHFKDL